MDDAMRRQIEDDAKRAGWDAYRLAKGDGFALTNDEAYLVYKIVLDTVANSTNANFRAKVGDENAISTAVKLCVRLAAAMPDRPKKDNT